MTTIGVLGADWRASVTPWGGVELWDDDRSLDWWIAADDRWHTPSAETTVRQYRVEGTPVVETRVKVPTGDVVQRVYAIADLGGLVVVEVENTSTLPVAIAFGRADLLTSRAVADVPLQGIDLPAEAFLLPLSHNGVIRVALPVAGKSFAVPAHLVDPSARVLGALPDGIPTAAQVARGWLTQTERRGRLVLPDAALAERITAERCDLALAGLDDPADDPIGFLLGVHELSRLGADPDPWIPEVVDATTRVGRTAAKRGLGWDADRALVAAEAVLGAMGEKRAVRDVGDLRRRLPQRSSRALTVPDGLRAVAWAEDLLARPQPDGSCLLLADGVPANWLGSSFEGYQLPGGGGRTVSYAVRWHADRPAALWEVSGPDGLRLGCGFDATWSSTERAGDVLWAAPPVPEGAIAATPRQPEERLASSPTQTARRSIPLRVDEGGSQSFN